MRFQIGFAIAGLTQGSMFDLNKQFDALIKPYIRQQPGFADFKNCLEEKRNKIKTNPTKEAVIEMENACGRKLRMLSDENTFNTVDLIRNIIAFEKEINNHLRQFGGIQVPDDGYIEYLHDGSRVGGELANCLNDHENVLMESIDEGFSESWRNLEQECRRFIIKDEEYANTLVAYNAHVTGLVSFQETMGPFLKLVNLELMRVLVASRTAMKQAMDEEDIDKLNLLYQLGRDMVIAHFDEIAKHIAHVKGIQLLRQTAVATINVVLPDPPQAESGNTEKYWAKMRQDFDEAYSEKELEEMREVRLGYMADLAGKVDDIAIAALASRFQNPLV